MHDSRDNQDVPTAGWFLNVNNIAYREALGGAESFDAYRVDLKTFWKHGSGPVLAVRQYNWSASDAPSAAQATVTLRGYKQGQYLSPYMSSLEVEERLSFTGDGAPRCLLVRRGCTARHWSRSPQHLSDFRSRCALRAQTEGAHERESRVCPGH
jgi:hypothetical protein